MVENSFSDQLQIILFFAVLSLIIVTYASRKGFFHLRVIRPALHITFWNVVSVFAIYLGVMLLVAPLIARILKIFLSSDSPNFLGLTQFISVLIAFLLLFAYGLRDKVLMKHIWKDPSSKESSSWLRDFGIGMLAWCIIFPVVATLGELFDFLIYNVLKFRQYDQVAIRYLKNSFNSSFSLTLALFTIILAAPIIEEFLFRGCLQNWLKRRLGFKAAILLTSFFFAFFHLSPSQGAGNISLFLTLMAFACFLGFIYERQRSLFASIGLHMTFNLISAFRLIFGPDI